MSRARPQQTRRPRLGAVHALLLAAGAAAVTPTFPVHAQDAGALRGTVADDPLDQLLLLAAPYGDHWTPHRHSAPPADLTDETPTGTVRAPTIDSQDEPILDPGAERAQAIEGLERKAKENLFEAPGIRVGSFILKPTVEQGVTVTSNADSDPLRLGRGAVGNGAAPECSVRLGEPFGDDRRLRHLPQDHFRRGDRRFAGGIAGALELELGKDYRGLATLGYARRPESATSPVVIVGAAAQPHSGDPDRQPRPREGRRQGAFRGDRRRRAGPVWRRRAGIRRRAVAGGPQFDAVFDDAARRLRDFACADAFHRNGSRPPALRFAGGQRRLRPFVRPLRGSRRTGARSRRKTVRGVQGRLGSRGVRRPTPYPDLGANHRRRSFPGRRCAAPSST